MDCVVFSPSEKPSSKPKDYDDAGDRGAVANNGSDLRRNWKVACRIRPFPSPDDPLSAANEDLRFSGDAGMVKVGGSAGAQKKSKCVLLCSCAAVRI